MYILAIDTTAKTAACSVCTEKNNKVFPICSSQLNSTLTHSESILPMIDFCLKNASLTVDDMDIIAVSAGPGSFTGVRIGIATVMGLAFGNKKRNCVSVSALEALALNYDDASLNTVVCACMDARRNQFYNALFKTDCNGSVSRLCEDRAISYEELFNELCGNHADKHIVLVGDGAELAYNLFNKLDGFDKLDVMLSSYERMYQSGISVAKCAYLHKNDAISSYELSPVYLRMSQAERERSEKECKE